MKLSKLIHEIWKDERIKDLRLRKEEVKIITEVVIDQIGKCLLKSGSVKLKNLFTLEIRKAKGRKIMNPKTKEPMYSNDYYKIGIKPSQKIKDGLKKLKNN